MYLVIPFLALFYWLAMDFMCFDSVVLHCCSILPIATSIPVFYDRATDDDRFDSPCTLCAIRNAIGSIGGKYITLLDWNNVSSGHPGHDSGGTSAGAIPFLMHLMGIPGSLLRSSINSWPLFHIVSIPTLFRLITDQTANSIFDFHWFILSTTYTPHFIINARTNCIYEIVDAHSVAIVISNGNYWLMDSLSDEPILIDINATIDFYDSKSFDSDLVVTAGITLANSNKWLSVMPFNLKEIAGSPECSMFYSPIRSFAINK